jgi:hypothetical protein
MMVIGAMGRRGLAEALTGPRLELEVVGLEYRRLV